MIHQWKCEHCEHLHAYVFLYNLYTPMWSYVIPCDPMWPYVILCDPMWSYVHTFYIFLSSQYTLETTNLSHKSGWVFRHVLPTNLVESYHPIHSTARRVTHSIGSSISQALDSTSSWLDVACAKWRFHHGFTMKHGSFTYLNHQKLLNYVKLSGSLPLYPFLSPISIYWFIDV
jgi:hypothetical protein